MTRLVVRLFGLLILLGLPLGGLLLAALDNTPLVERSASISPAAINQAHWLYQTDDPRRLKPGESHQTEVPAALADEGINFLASRFLRGRGALVLGEGTAEARFTLRAPMLPGEHYFNFRATLFEGEGEPKIAKASIGHLPIPPMLLEFALATAAQAVGYGEQWKQARQAVRQLSFDPKRQRIVVAYVWEPTLLDHARAIAVKSDDLIRIRTAQTALAAQFDRYEPGSSVPLTVMLRTVLDDKGAEQAENRRAALLVLGVYLAEKNITSIIPEARNWPQLRPLELKLAGRHDSAQHFVVSATLAAWAGEPIADAIGVYKEMADARHGSGFSFADLAADRAGTRFGELFNRRDARLNALLDKKLIDADVIPIISDLPESLDAAEFRRRFGNTHSAAYRQIANEIERRLDAMPLYKPE